MGKVILTFDTEDFTNWNSISILRRLLLCLAKHDVKGIFFITGHMAETLTEHKEIVRLLNRHEIGYHSSSHSVHPAIYEFTDIENYEKAYEIAATREKSHINPLNGQIEHEGGILALRSLFKGKEIVSFRAPGFCWSPSHSEALRDLGLRFDFSANISQSPAIFKGITFYPYPSFFDWNNRPSSYKEFFLSVLKDKFTVMVWHPSMFLHQNQWDSIYYAGNPEQISSPILRPSSEFQSLFRGFELFLMRTKSIEKTGLIDMVPNLRMANEDFSPKITASVIEKVYQSSVWWPEHVFNYKPKHIRNHFQKFFNSSE